MYTFDGSNSSSYNWWSLSKLHILFDRDLIFTCLYIQLPLMYLLGIQMPIELRLTRSCGIMLQVIVIPIFFVYVFRIGPFFKRMH